LTESKKSNFPASERDLLSRIQANLYKIQALRDKNEALVALLKKARATK